MEVQRSWPTPALLILATAAPWVASIRNGEFDGASAGFISWENLNGDISRNTDFEQDAYLGKVSSSYTWRARTIMELGQEDVHVGKVGMETILKTRIPCVIKVPCQEFWTADGTHRTSQLFLHRKEPTYSEFGADEKALAQAKWKKTQDLIYWAENDCHMATYLSEQGLPVVPCLYTSTSDAQTGNQKHIMFNVFKDYAPAPLAWNEFVLDKDHKQIALEFYSVMWYSLNAVNELHKVEKIHHHLTLDGIALQLSQHGGDDGQQVSVKLTDFERMTSAAFDGSVPNLEDYLTAVYGGTWDYYLGSPPEVRENTFYNGHVQNPRAFDVFMLGCALLHMMTGAAPQDMLFLLQQKAYQESVRSPEGYYKGKAPEGGPHLFFNHKGEYLKPSGPTPMPSGDNWHPTSIAEAFHNWVRSQSAGEGDRSGELNPESLSGVVNEFIREDPRWYRKQPWYPKVVRFFAQELPNVREAHVSKKGPVYNFNNGVLNIIAKMLSFEPDKRPSIQEILSDQMPPLQKLLNEIA